MDISAMIEQLQADFKGYHLEIQIFPSGGLIDAMGCSECGTSEDTVEFAGWGKKRRCKTPAEAVADLKRKLGIANIPLDNGLQPPLQALPASA